MNFFPTWRVWRLLHTYNDPERYEILTLILRAKDPVTWLQIIHNLWIWIMLSWAISIAINFAISQLPFLIQNYWIVTAISWGVLLLVHLICLRFALPVLNILRRQRTTGQYDLLFILPINEYNHVLDMMRARRYPFDGVIRGKWSGIFIAVLLAVITLNLRLSMGVSFPLNLIQTGTALIGGVHEFIHYLQLFTATALVTLLVSQIKHSVLATGLVIAFLIAQVIIFTLISQFFAEIAFNQLVDISNPSRFEIYPYLWWAALFHPLLLAASRELVNFALLHAVKHRLETSP